MYTTKTVSLLRRASTLLITRSRTKSSAYQVNLVSLSFYTLLDFVSRWASCSFAVLLFFMVISIYFIDRFYVTSVLRIEQGECDLLS